MLHTDSEINGTMSSIGNSSLSPADAPAMYDYQMEDIIWLLLTSFLILTMQTG